jgi:hypothetical protein
MFFSHLSAVLQLQVFCLSLSTESYFYTGLRMAEWGAIIGCSAAVGVVCSMVCSPVLAQDSQDQVLQSGQHCQLLCSNSAMNGFCVQLDIL